MILVGQMDSPFVRRVAVSMNLYAMPFERNAISVFADAEAVRAVNPLGKVPALVLDDGETLFDSQMILDHLDELAGPEQALTPSKGKARRRVLASVAVALGLAEKVVALNFETRQRPAGTIDDGVVARLETQVASALGWLEGLRPAPWLCGGAMTQADVTAACALTHVVNRRPELFPEGGYPALADLCQRCEEIPAFKASPFADG